MLPTALKVVLERRAISRPTMGVADPPLTGVAIENNGVVFISYLDIGAVRGVAQYRGDQPDGPA